MSDEAPKITKEVVQRIEDALEERKNRRDRRATEKAPPTGVERRRSRGRRLTDYLP